MVSSLGNIPLSGMNNAITQLNKTATRVANPERALENVTQNAVDLVVAPNTYKINAKVVKTQDEMVGTLLNMVA